jgi:hypothetical protein
MGRWEHRHLGWDRFPDPSTPIEIEQLFTLEWSRKLTRVSYDQDRVGRSRT